MLGLIEHYWLAGGSVDEHRKIAKDLRDLGERCSRHRVHRLMRRQRQGWMYLAVVIDLFSSQVVGLAMRDRADAELVVQALLSAVWRRKPTPGVWFTRTKGRSTPAMTGRVSWRPMAWCAV
ncbi:putative isxac3 transposase orfb (fragment) protein [Xanthomonas albilineans GPE PC73]|uniref:Putative isxac3 transposase orfb protein n=1 Tax=Xanthomonas albilineans (strain GPE PC73 / CFBP 7063) TaxID=380358 RepID=D2UE98_XANAP